MLKKIIIREFKGIHFFELDLKAKTIIEAGNGKGKSSIVDAFLWCLKGVDARDKSDYKIRNINAPERDPEVELHFDNIKFKRRNTEINNGFKTRYYIDKGLGFDEINLSDTFVNNELVKGFDSYVKDNFPELKICANIRYLPEIMTNKEARSYILRHTKNVLDEEIFEEMEPKLAEIAREILQAYGANEALKILKNKLTKLKREKHEKNGEIKGHVKDIDATKPEIPKFTAEQEINEINKKIARNEEQLKLVDVSADLYKALEETKAGKDRAEAEHTRQYNKKYQAWEDHKNELSRQFRDKQAEQDSIYNDKKRALKNLIEELEEPFKIKLDAENSKEKIEKLEADLAEEKAKEFKEVSFQAFDFEERIFDEESKICALCGQTLPLENIEKLRYKFDSEEERRKNDFIKSVKQQRESFERQINSEKEQFNRNKQEKIEKILKEIDELTESIAKASNVELNQDRLNQAKNDLENLERIELIAPAVPEQPKKEDFNSLEYNKSIEKAEQDLLKAKETNEKRKAPVYEIIENLKKEKAEKEKIIAEYAALEKLTKQLDATKAEKAAIARDINETELKLKAIGEYLNTMAEMLQDEVMQKFGINVKLFETQITNGILKNVFDVLCETPNGKIPYSTANNAARIKTMMVFCEKAQSLHSCRIPIFIDNSESVIKLPDIDAQTVELRVKDVPDMEVK